MDEATTDAPLDPPVDGRTARTARTQTTIVDAILALIEEGDLQPTANRIAERAGVSLRLIYHHFGDLETLFGAAAKREAERIAAHATPIDVTLPLDERIEAIVAERARVLEWITPVRRASQLYEGSSPELSSARDAFYALAHQQVDAVFAPELAARPTGSRDATRHALGAALLWGTWNDLRLSGFTVAEARDAVLATVRALLGS